MKNKIIISLKICIVALLHVKSLNAQILQTDVVKIMTYNVGAYGSTSSGCPLQTIAAKNPYLRTILEYVQPDIIGMEKMKASSSIATSTVVTNVLDSLCTGCFGHSTYTNVTGDSRTNMLYFNINKFGFVSTVPVYTADPNISDINLTKLYYKSPNLSTTHDTIFISFILVHLLSGSTSVASRTTEANGVMTWLNANITTSENIIVMGDFNTLASSEGCFTAFINSSNNITKFFDPPNQLGSWSSFPSNFANYITHSTRTTDPGDCLATGGLVNRFDHILCNTAIMNATDSISYITNSYKVIGQDGLHIGHSMIDAPTNSVVPGIVDSALYYMSEHLPVTINLAITYTVYSGIDTISKAKNLEIKYNTITTNNITINVVKSTIPEFLNNCEAMIYDIQGRLISNNIINLNQTNTLDISTLANGMYLLKLSKNGTPFFNGKMVKE